MSEQKKPRTKEEIQNEYQSGCLRLGHIEYQIDALSKDAKMLKETLRDLNFEAVSIAQKEAEAQKAEEKKEA